MVSALASACLVAPPSPARADAGLELTAGVDRATVRVGGEITYTMDLHNPGDRSFSGPLTLESHVPPGTTFVMERPARCNGASIQISTDDGLCVWPNGERPATGFPTVHEETRVTQRLVVRPQETLRWLFVVRVGPGTVGRTLTNHAHLTAIREADAAGTSGPAAITQTADAPVVVVVP